MSGIPRTGYVFLQDPYRFLAGNRVWVISRNRAGVITGNRVGVIGRNRAGSAGQEEAGRGIRSVSELNEGEILHTRLRDGSFESRVTSINKEEEDHGKKIRGF